MDWKDEVYEVVKKIPKGKVATYGEIALRLLRQAQDSVRSGPAAKITPRMVGRALHNNPDPENIPCHRVVDRNGRLAENFAFSSRGRQASGPGGWREQRRRLVAEGVRFRDAMHVDLKTCLWQVKFQ